MEGIDVVIDIIISINIGLMIIFANKYQKENVAVIKDINLWISIVNGAAAFILFVIEIARLT